MAEFEVGGHKYMTGQLNARQQWNIARRLLKVLAGLKPLATAWAGSEVAKRQAEKLDTEEAREAVAAKAAELGDMRDKLLDDLAEALSNLKDEDSDYIINTCYSVTSRWQESGGWAPVWNTAAKREMFEFQMPEMLTIVGTVIEEQLSGFFK